MNYYNEIDKFAAEWLRNLITAGLIPPGVVDERSIEDVTPADLVGFRQCHFFAGIGGWPLALRTAGVPDDYEIWTGSCPCQPFSAAGEGAGFADERHLWPVFHYLIEQRRPASVLGEQVASKDAEPWLDLVRADLEGLGYAFGAVAFPAAGIGAPHIRDRSYWGAVAGGGRGPAAGHAHHPRLEGYAGHGGAAGGQGQERPVAAAGIPVRLADHESSGRREERADAGGLAGGDRAQGIAAGLVHGGGAGGLANSSNHSDGALGRPGPVNGFWSDADWLFCRDGKWRPVEAGTFPLAHGLPRSVGSGGAGLERLASLAGLDGASLARAKQYRVGALRGYGNAINIEAAVAFVDSFLCLAV